MLNTDLADVHRSWSEFGHHHNRVNSEHFGLLTSLLHWAYKLRILGVVREMTLFFEYDPRSSLHLDKARQVGALIPRASSPLPTLQTSVKLSGKRYLLYFPTQTRQLN